MSNLKNSSSERKVRENLIEENFVSLLVKQDYENISFDSQWVLDRNLDQYINFELLEERLKKINSNIDQYFINQVFSKLKKINNPSLFETNKAFHNFLINGITIDDDKNKISKLIKLIDFDNPHNNTFQVVRQLKCRESNNLRIPDVIIYVNGLPLVIVELKNFGDEQNKVSLNEAYKQLGSNSEKDGYRFDIPGLFHTNAFLVIGDGATFKVGTLTSKIERYSIWKSVAGEKPYDVDTNQIQTLINGLFNKQRLLDVIKNNLFFIKTNKEKPVKILAQYHQYFGVIKALEKINSHIKPNGDGKAGVIWHTQGSGKSFSMLMLAHRLMTSVHYSNPTIVVLTDRNELDDQLFTTFSSASEFLRTTPIQVNSKKELSELVNSTKYGKIIFTTVQMFINNEMIDKNERNNIIVIADEAHRSHFGINEEIKYKKSRVNDDELDRISHFGIEHQIRQAFPNATFLGFTGTPVVSRHKSIYDIYGGLIDVYDMWQSVEDGSTVTIYYEKRYTQFSAKADVLKEIDKCYEQASSELDEEQISHSKAKMTKLYNILEDPDIINELTKNILSHYEKRKVLLNGKAMIVAFSRKSAFMIYQEILKLKPELRDQIACICTNSNKDTEEMHKVFGNEDYRDNIKNEFKKDDSKIKIIIVCDMLLTGYDVPDLDTMYIFKKMSDHNLMQAVARVNRTYPNKIAGLIVDYIGIKKELDKAIDDFTERDRKINFKNIKADAYQILCEYLEKIEEIFSKNNYEDKFDKINENRYEKVRNAANLIIELKLEKDYLMYSKSLKKAYTICSTIIEDDYENSKIIFFLEIRSFLLKINEGYAAISIDELNENVKQLMNEAVQCDEYKTLQKYVDKNNSQSIQVLLDPNKLAQLRKTHKKHIYEVMLQNLLKTSIAKFRKVNYIKAEQFSEKLIDLINQYNKKQKDSIDSQFIEDSFVRLAKDILENSNEAEIKGLDYREKAFYTALINNESAREELDEPTLKLMAHELREIIEKVIEIPDWQIRDNIKSGLKTKIKKLLKIYKYPPKFENKAILDVIKQANYLIDGDDEYY
ncbi:type I restriction endonuclease subunit R [Mycoplasmopsis caviae]|uniref:Type I restriction enzyme endonuclease subunit n=1 Tax=Mycoplasmopsis caviae TaxID=55603 RepID=A0A3P8LI85_9BACT|nr:type I restriction endonuclease subunit R [Mycoplasmopsis caviae]UUD35073.1 type I restriction endonuclease subunit R [Mycoplasmopsis caviae]VDR42102.1 Type-1 restriction enzyme R protein [Mycoplasmopsis caviae]